jgi:hypothetical protein
MPRFVSSNNQTEKIKHMSYKILASAKLSTSLIYKEITSNIESLLLWLTNKWNSAPDLTVNILRVKEDTYLLTYSIDVNGTYFYMSTSGADLLKMTENLKHKIINI